MDERLFHLINGRWSGPALDRIMATASSLDVWLPLIALLVALTAWYGRRRARLFLMALALTLAIGDGAVSNGLKHFVHRPRPFQSIGYVRQVQLARHGQPRFVTLFRPLLVTCLPTPDAMPDPGAGRSFPSSHTVNNFGVAMLLALFYGWRGAAYFLPASLVAYSRVYVGSHWPSDVLISAFLGAGLVLLGMALFRVAVTRWPALSAHLAP